MRDAELELRRVMEEKTEGLGRPGHESQIRVVAFREDLISLRVNLLIK